MDLSSDLPDPTRSSAPPAPHGGGLPKPAKKWWENAAKPDDRAWERTLPMRFNPPPGWAPPNEQWVLTHIGLDMSDKWVPDGAGAPPTGDWTWWTVQEPPWSAWITTQERSNRRAMGLWTFVLLTSSIMAFAVGVSGDWLFVVLVTAAWISGVMLVRSFIATHLSRRDPMGHFRDQYVPFEDFSGF